MGSCCSKDGDSIFGGLRQPLLHTGRKMPEVRTVTGPTTHSIQDPSDYVPPGSNVAVPASPAGRSAPVPHSSDPRRLSHTGGVVSPGSGAPSSLGSNLSSSVSSASSLDPVPPNTPSSFMVSHINPAMSPEVLQAAVRQVEQSRPDVHSQMQVHQSQEHADPLSIEHGVLELHDTQESDNIAAEEAQKAKEEADKIAAEKIAEDARQAQEEADRVVAEQLAEHIRKAHEEAERIAAEEARKAKEEAAKIAAEKIAAEVARQEHEESDRVAAEKIAKEESDRVAAEKIAEDALKEESDRVAAEKIADDDRKAQEEEAGVAVLKQAEEDYVVAQAAEIAKAQDVEAAQFDAERELLEEQQRQEQEPQVSDTTEATETAQDPSTPGRRHKLGELGRTQSTVEDVPIDPQRELLGGTLRNKGTSRRRPVAPRKTAMDLEFQRDQLIEKGEISSDVVRKPLEQDLAANPDSETSVASSSAAETNAAPVAAEAESPKLRIAGMPKAGFGPQIGGMVDMKAVMAKRTSLKSTKDQN